MIVSLPADGLEVRPVRVFAASSLQADRSAQNVVRDGEDVHQRHGNAAQLSHKNLTAISTLSSDDWSGYDSLMAEEAAVRPPPPLYITTLVPQTRAQVLNPVHGMRMQGRSQFCKITGGRCISIS